MILDIPELLLKVAHFSDWRAVLGLQRLNRGAYRDRPVLVQEELWRCAVRSRWPWSVYVEPEGFLDERELITACGSWRRAYAYLRTVGFAPSVLQSQYWRHARVPSLRVSRTPAYNPRYGLGAPNPPLSRVEECAWSEEPLIEARREHPLSVASALMHSCAFADVRPGLCPGPKIWVAHFTAYAPDADGLFLGVTTDDRAHNWYFDIGGCLLDAWFNPPGENGYRAVPAIPALFLDGERIECDVFKAPVRLRLIVNLEMSALGLDVLHTRKTSDRIYPVSLTHTLHDFDLPETARLRTIAASHRMHFFVGFGAVYEPEDNAPYEVPSDVDEWNPWSDHYPERLRRRGFVTLDALYPAPGRRAE